MRSSVSVAPARSPSALARPRSSARPAIAVLSTALVGLVIGATCWGPVPIDPVLTLRIIGAHLLPGEHVADWTPVQQQIVWSFRLPRVLLAALVGACLALVGTVLQALVRNPLADPYVLGSSSGAALGAVIALASGAAVPGSLVSGSAFGGAMAAGLVVYALSSRGGRIESLRLVLAGVAVGYLFSAITSWITVTAEHGKLPGILFFLLGSVSSATWESLVLPLVGLLGGLLYARWRVDHLNAALAGDETAASLGMDVTRFRIESLVVTSFMVGCVVAVAGGVGFVGMVVPHLCRLVVGAEHRRLLPVAVLAGAVLVVVVDTLARTVAAPRELPLGVVTALVGAPFFLWLLRRSGAEAPR